VIAFNEQKRAMREVMQKIVATEAEAKRMVQAAQAEAERLLSDARKQAKVLIEHARAETRVESQNVLATAEMLATQEKARRLEKIRTEINSQIQLDAATAQQITDAAVRCVCGFG
jgi:vacuolar-type H+-ATPase subunit H